MKYSFLLLFLFSTSLFAQSGMIKGTVKDGATGEAIIGASVSYASGKGAQTDIDGNFSIKIDSAGEYILAVAYIGYDAQNQKIKFDPSKAVTVNFALQAQTLKEVEIVSDVAKTRVTPVAFSNISVQQIQEELGTRDIPMILNTTPGAYATEQGGGNGDARINIRGFSQSYIGVMVDGVPVNDMENGQVFWSNWDGLGGITRSMQVQRGLGASKLALPSVGGTMNILTKGIDEKMATSIKQEVTDYGLYKTSFGYNSGLLKGGWGATIAGSRKSGTDWADGTYVDGWSYFAKVQKRFNKHLFSLSANGAPQSHGQRYTRLPIAIYNHAMAQSLGINTDSVYKNSNTTLSKGERGLRYNPDWGMLNGKEFSGQFNFFHKPAINFSHFWTPNEKLSVSTVAYLSSGTGGGAYMITAPNRNANDGTLNMQKVYDDNLTHISSYYTTSEHSATNYLKANRNDHIWYGVLSSWDYKVSKNVSALIGIDARYYKGTHFMTPLDLMGADYAADASDNNQPKPSYYGDPNWQYGMKRIGDKVSYYYDTKVMWGGVFGQVEYKKEKWSTFFTLTGSDKSYQRIDYFQRRDLVIDGNTFSQAVGYGEGFYYNGTQHLNTVFGSSAVNGENTVVVKGDTTFIGTGVYKKYILNAKRYGNDSPEARTNTTDRKWYVGYTAKGGVNYNINDHHNAFMNIGYMSIAPNSNAVFDNSNHLFAEINNQNIYAIEGGYGLKYSEFAAMVNLYYTYWKNKPLIGKNGDNVAYNINGIDAVHKGIELNGNYKVTKNLSADLIISVADWRTISAAKSYIIDQGGVILDSVDFSAKNVHVGDAAQLQLGGGVRYEIIKSLYFKPRFMYFGKHYANFDPLTLKNINVDRESWKMPAYGLLDLFVGYDYKIWKTKVGITAGVTNVLDKVYITDGVNGAGFNATTTLVYMGMGRRITIGFKIAF